jgi:hypothetical protein
MTPLTKSFSAVVAMLVAQLPPHIDMNIRIVIGLLIACLIESRFVFAQTSLVNPILTGFYPDPSVLRISLEYQFFKARI